MGSWAVEMVYICNTEATKFYLISIDFGTESVIIKINNGWLSFLSVGGVMMFESIKIYRVILFSLIAYYGCSMAEIRVIDSLEQAISDLKTADESTLVVFDIDNTLTYEVNVFRQKWFANTAAGKQFWQIVQKYYQSMPRPAEFKTMVDSKRMKYFSADRPVESMTTSVVDMIQHSGAKVIALTACKTGAYGLIDCMEEWRVEKLSDIGIDFSGSFAEQKIIIDALTDRAGKYPVFYKGIMLSEEDSIEKGAALGAFLDRVQLRPGKVLFFDDKRCNLQSVQAEMARRSIPFMGYEYTAVEKLPRRYNPAILQCQLDHLKEYGEFISDETATKLLQQTSTSYVPYQESDRLDLV